MEGKHIIAHSVTLLDRDNPNDDENNPPQDDENITPDTQ